tara:strand:- start:260 stop:433 length:174 start_codon:yes stop_codon:yes gene_type:complete
MPSNTDWNDCSVKEYFTQLSDKEKQIVKLAEEKLGSSFNIEKTKGYLDWIHDKSVGL